MPHVSLRLFETLSIEVSTSEHRRGFTVGGALDGGGEGPCALAAAVVQVRREGDEQAVPLQVGAAPLEGCVSHLDLRPAHRGSYVTRPLGENLTRFSVSTLGSALA